MLNAKKTQTINGISYFIENGVKVQVASMYAALDDAGNRSENYTIINQDLYNKYYADVEADITEFKKMVETLGD